jgi:AraC family transcriptional regulator of arabinose operon
LQQFRFYDPESMSKPSQWPLPADGVRLLTPGFVAERLHRHPLTRDCYPTAMGFYPAATGHRMRRDRHDDNLLLFCTEGRGRLMVSGQRLRIGPGDVALLPQGLAHSYRADRADPWSLYWVHFRGVASGVFVSHVGYREESPVVHCGVTPALVSSFSAMLEVRSTGYGMDAFVHAANQLRQLLTGFALARSAPPSARAGELDIEGIQRLMRARLDQPLTLETLAESAGLSKYHFATRYKALTGYSPMRHFTNLKMEAACRLLDSTDASVKTVAAELGYTDPLYFSRQFRRTVGLSPRAYRSSVRR